MENRTYKIEFCWFSGTEVYCPETKERYRVKRKYNMLIALLGCVGWIPVILIGIWGPDSLFLRIFTALVCVLGATFLSMYGFHRFLLRQDRCGTIMKYLEIK